MKKGRLAALLLAVVVGAGSLAATAYAAPAEISEQTAKAAAFAKVSDWALDDWSIFALARSGESGCETLFENYCEKTLDLLEDPSANLACGDYIKMALALTAIGVDPQNAGGHNLLALIDAFDRQQYLELSTTSLAYALVLMTRYPDAFTGTIREETIQQILAARQADHSFSYLAGVEASDPDSTAQAIQGLMLLGDAYAAEIQAAADWLKGQMDENGAILNWGSANPASTAQALVAFSQMGEEPENAQGETLYNGMMDFALADGSFQDVNWQTGGLEYNAYASGQCFQGLVAYQRMATRQAPLLDVRDVTVTARPKQEDTSSQSGSSHEPKPDFSQPQASAFSQEAVSSPSKESPEETVSLEEDLKTYQTGDMAPVSIAALGFAAAASALLLCRKRGTVL